MLVPGTSVPDGDRRDLEIRKVGRRQLGGRQPRRVRAALHRFEDRARMALRKALERRRRVGDDAARDRYAEARDHGELHRLGLMKLDGVPAVDPARRQPDQDRLQQAAGIVLRDHGLPLVRRLGRRDAVVVPPVHRADRVEWNLPAAGRDDLAGLLDRIERDRHGRRERGGVDVDGVGAPRAQGVAHVNGMLVVARAQDQNGHGESGCAGGPQRRQAIARPTVKP
jgi:hypothetical protein